MSARLVMCGLAAQQSEGVLCDVILEAEGKQLHAHRAVLAAVSPYFNVMFTSDFKEKNEKVITLHDVKYRSLSVAISSIYKSQFKLTNRTVADVLGTASLLQITGLVHECKQYMFEKMSKSTWLQFRSLGEKYWLNDVIAKADEFLLKNFVEISTTQDFMDLSKELLVRYLSNDCLNSNGNELCVFEAAYRWLEADTKRMQHVLEVMQHVRFIVYACWF